MQASYPRSTTSTITATATSTALRDPFLWAASIFFGALLCALGVVRYLGFTVDMFDLGNMSQAIASVQRGQPLVFTFSEGQMSRLALHVEWFYFVLALPYALWPDPRLLIAIQALCYALGSIPVYQMALRRTESQLAARCLSLIYLMYPVAQTAVLLDIHGDTFAMPFLLWMLDALDQRAWRRYWVFLVLALSCKFYVALPLALLGPLIWCFYGERRVAIATIVSALGYGLIAFFVIRPLFTTAETSSLHRGANYLTFYFGQLGILQESIGWRMANALIVFGPLAFLLVRSWPWIMPSMAIALPALISTVDNSASYGSHHYAIAVPFLVVGAIDGVDRMRRGIGPLQPLDAPVQQATKPGRSWHNDLLFTTLIVVFANLALVDTPLSPRFWMGLPNTGRDPSWYFINSRDRVKPAFLDAHIPPDAPLAASLYLAPHLVNRETLYMTRYEVNQSQRPFRDILPHIDYAVLDALFDIRALLPNGGFDGGAASERDEIATLLRDPDFGLVAMHDGLVVFQRNPAAEVVLEQAIEVESSAQDNTPVQARFDDAISLLEATIEPQGGRRFRATFTWRAAHASLPAYVAVSRLEGVDDARIVHLPTYVLQPTQAWPASVPIREQFDVVFPDTIPAGRYLWKVGWYNLSNSEAYATDSRSRVGAEVPILSIDLQ